MTDLWLGVLGYRLETKTSAGCRAVAYNWCPTRHTVCVTHPRWHLISTDLVDTIFIDDAFSGQLLEQILADKGLEADDFAFDVRAPEGNWVRWNRHLNEEELQIIGSVIDEVRLSENVAEDDN